MVELVRRLHKRLHLPPLYWALIVLGAWFMIFRIGELEGRLFPAAEPMELLGHFPTSINHPREFEWDKLTSGQDTAFWILTTRLRPECGPERLEWRLGERNSNRQGAKVTVIWGPPQNRDDYTEFAAGPWVAHLSYDQFLGTYGDVIHICTTFGLFPREVRTRLWN